MFALVLPVEVLPAVDLALLVEALLVEQLAADLALDAARVPRLVEEVQQEAVEDGAGAPGAVHRHHPEKRERERKVSLTRRKAFVVIDAELSGKALINLLRA